MGRRNRRDRDDPMLAEFLREAQSHVGGYYRHGPTGAPVEFIRPLGKIFMRVRNMLTDEKFNAPYGALHPINEMEVIALQLVDPEPEPEPELPDTSGDDPETRHEVDVLIDDLLGR